MHNNHNEHEIPMSKLNNKPSILIVEDNEINMLLMKEALSMYDYILYDAINGEEALAIFYKKKPDIILMDIQLPDIDGTEVLKRIRKEAKSSVPVIALTAYALSGDEDKYITEGFDDYVSKPINIEDLITKIEKLL